MATKIPIGTAAYLTDFEHGQGAGASNYFTFDSDLDIDFVLIRVTINQMIDEISAVSGPNAVAALDLVLWDDAENPISSAEQNYGVVGAASYEVSVEGGGTLEIKKGQAFIAGQRVSLISTLTGITSSGGSGTRWVAIDANGAVFIESLAAQKSLDIASVTWNGSIFTGTPTHLADVFFDGDSWAELRNRNAAGGGFPAIVYRRVSERFEYIEQSLSAAAGGAGLIALPPGAIGAPGLVFTDGAGAADTTTGWYRVAADLWAFVTSSTERFRLGAFGIRTQNGTVGTPPIAAAGDTDTGIRWGAALMGLVVSGADVLQLVAGQAKLALGVIGTPALAFIGDTTTGWYRIAANVWAFVASGVLKVTLDTAGVKAIDGVVGTPSYSFLTRATTGLYSPAADVAGLAGGGELAVEAGKLTAGGVGLPNLLRCQANNIGSAETLTDATWTVVDLDASPDPFDVGGWHDPLGANPDQVVVPTNGDGLYRVTAHAKFAVGTPDGDRGLRITLGGTAIPESVVVRQPSALATEIVTVCDLDLVATNILRVEAYEDDTGGAITAECSLTVVRDA
jgi:hypothetical protein